VITADNITDEQIRELKTEVEMADSATADSLCALAGVTFLDDIETDCVVALNPACGRHYRTSRARCAALISARKSAEFK